MTNQLPTQSVGKMISFKDPDHQLDRGAIVMGPVQICVQRSLDGKPVHRIFLKQIQQVIPPLFRNITMEYYCLLIYSEFPRSLFLVCSLNWKFHVYCTLCLNAIFGNPSQILFRSGDKPNCNPRHIRRSSS